MKALRRRGAILSVQVHSFGRESEHPSAPDSVRVVIRSWQDVDFASPPAELINRRRIGPVYPLHGPKSEGLEDAGGSF